MGLSLTVLGCAATFPRPGGPCSGYLLQTPRTSVWVDCGPGTIAALQEHIAPGQLTAIWLFHLHPDHWADLLSALNWVINTPGAPRLWVYAPPSSAAWKRRKRERPAVRAGSAGTTAMSSPRLLGLLR
jgi:ribonuclease BN (tRNA processing enzyme)